MSLKAIWEQMLYEGEQNPAIRQARSPSKRKVRQPIKTVLIAIPWLIAAAVAWFSLFTDRETVASSLSLGLYKTIWVVILTWIADSSLFWFASGQQGNNAMAQIRRAIIFLGLCWMLAVA